MVCRKGQNVLTASGGCCGSDGSECISYQGLGKFIYVHSKKNILHNKIGNAPVIKNTASTSNVKIWIKVARVSLCGIYLKKKNLQFSLREILMEYVKNILLW